ncbi:carbonic anhydrase [Cryobacterium tepidiphilum]|uniref:Carbonic anhydrase n=2 Tax=Cryobacterium tepidiphilum TaxID=2486026 RepID=A0A3M8LEE5_9MICO|nr:carbonic anhydrase [Cryobacterium tepidiphilum]
MQRGNERFVSGAPRHPRQDVELRAELGRGQAPHAVLLGCSDSRLAAEIIFDEGLGDLFVIRNAGQVASESALGSIEYAVGVLHVPLVIVLGHDSCGAVRAAIDSQADDAAPLPPHIDGLIQRIVPAVHEVTRADAAPVDPVSVDASAVGRTHVRNTISEMLEASEMISAAVADGTLAIVGANYRLVEGRVDPHVIVGMA